MRVPGVNLIRFSRKMSQRKIIARLHLKTLNDAYRFHLHFLSPALYRKLFAHLNKCLCSMELVSLKAHRLLIKEQQETVKIIK